jgi:hypothetical protein
VLGCFFHFKQALHRRSKLIGLSAYKGTNEIINLYGQLALLPPELIEKGIAAIVSFRNKKKFQSEPLVLLENFHEYFLKTWEGKKLSLKN